MKKDRQKLNVLSLESQRIKKSIKKCEYVGFGLEITFNSTEAAKDFSSKVSFQKTHQSRYTDEKMSRLLSVADHQIRLSNTPANVVLLSLAFTEKSVSGIRFEDQLGREIYTYSFPKK